MKRLKSCLIAVVVSLAAQTALAAKYSNIIYCEDATKQNASAQMWDKVYSSFPTSFADAVYRINRTNWCVMEPNDNTHHWKIMARTLAGGEVATPIFIHPKWKENEFFSRQHWKRVWEFCQVPADLNERFDFSVPYIERVYKSGKNAGKPCRIERMSTAKLHTSAIGKVLDKLLGK